MEDILGFFFLKRPNKKVRFSLFGVGQNDPEALLSPAFQQLVGVKFSKYDRRRNIAEVELDRRSPVTGDEIIQSIQAAGLAAEVLSSS